jgi:protein phosphatase
MGTTATVAALMDPRLFVAQVGDSRAYVLRGDKLVQISRDQSLVNQLIEAGQLTEEEAETFEHNNIILQALGTAETVQVDLTYVDLCRGDLLLLCSDGLSGMIRADEIREVLINIRDPLEACRELTDRANRVGGHDNITVIIAVFDGPGLPAADASTPELAYKKYPLPERSAADYPLLQVSPPEPRVEEPTVNEDLLREPRRLRVGHTVMGLTNPLAGLAVEAGGGDVGARVVRADEPLNDDPIELPTTGLAPSLVGFMVLGAMVLVAVAGFLLLR